MKIPGHVVDANHNAISMLAEGRTDDSLRLLRTTLSELKSTMTVQVEGCNQTIACPLLDGALPTIRLFSIAVPFKMRSSAVIHGGVFSFFNRAIAIAAQAPLAEETLEEGAHHHDVTMDPQKMAAVLLYNAGLCCHVKGMETCLNEDLVTALHFYRHAFSLLTETDAILGISDHDSLLVLSLANNMGHLNSNVFDEKASRVCFDMMQRLFPTADKSSTLEIEDALFFYLVTFLIPFDQLISSPAA